MICHFVTELTAKFDVTRRVQREKKKNGNIFKHSYTYSVQIAEFFQINFKGNSTMKIIRRKKRPRIKPRTISEHNSRRVNGISFKLIHLIFFKFFFFRLECYEHLPYYIIIIIISKWKKKWKIRRTLVSGCWRQWLKKKKCEKKKNFVFKFSKVWIE